MRVAGPHCRQGAAAVGGAPGSCSNRCRGRSLWPGQHHGAGVQARKVPSIRLPVVTSMAGNTRLPKMTCWCLGRQVPRNVPPESILYVWKEVATRGIVLLAFWRLPVLPLHAEAKVPDRTLDLHILCRFRPVCKAHGLMSNDAEQGVACD